MRTTRNRYYDIEAGILLCYMIFCHVAQWANMQDAPVSNLLKNIFFFFMPFFFFKGGVYFVNTDTNKIVRNSFKRLMIPYIVFSLMGHCLQCVHLILTENLSLQTAVLFPLLEVLKYGSVKGNLALWFLLSLYCVRVLFSVMVKRVAPTVIFLFFASISTILNTLDLTIPYYCENIPAGLMFFSAGYVMKEWQYHRTVIFVCALTYLSIFLFGYPVVHMRDNSLVSGYYIHWIYASIISIILLANILKRTEYLSVFAPFAYLGRNSMHYYVAHWMVLTLVMIVYIDILNLPVDSIYFVVLLVSCATLLPCVVHLLKHPKMDWAWGK